MAIRSFILVSVFLLVVFCLSYTSINGKISNTEHSLVHHSASDLGQKHEAGAMDGSEPSKNGENTTDLASNNENTDGEASKPKTSKHPRNESHLVYQVEKEILKGETMVIGGVTLPNGDSEFTLLRPEIISLPSGEKGIKLVPRVIAFESQFSQKIELHKIANWGDDPQPGAQAWNANKVSELAQLSYQNHSKHLAAGTIAMPMSSEPSVFHLELPSSSDEVYDLECTVTPMRTGGFLIESKVTRIFPLH